MEINNLEKNNDIELENNIVNEKMQKSFLETTLGKTINTAVDIGIRALLPDFVEDQIINIKDNLLNYGLKEGIQKTIGDAIDLGKSAIGIFTGNFENINQMQNAVQTGGLIDGISGLLDTVVDKVRQSGLINGTIANTIKNNSNLKPEIKSSYEAGLDMKFFQNKLGFDFTYYYSTTKNQAMLVKASAPWTEQWINAGEILNHGFEMMIYSTPYENKDFRFDLDLNLAKNISKVKSLADGVDHIYFNGDPNMPIQVGAVAGGSLGDIYAKTLIKRDSQGNVIVGSDGLPQNETGNGNLEQYLLDHPIGNINPDLLMSVTPSFNYKGISVSAMFDFKFGGDVVCMSEGMATSVGLAKRTEDRGEFKEVNGVEDFYMIVDGVKEDGTLNDIPVSAQKYYSTIGLYKEKGYAEEFIYDASYIKLKELSVGYSFPRSILKKTPFSSLKLSFVGRNLCYLHKNTPGNPDGGYDTSMFSQALDYLSVPYTRTFGFSINVGF